jgi:antitoxin component of RelBE/YafQ-DinJ toxin-antitoxin module
VTTEVIYARVPASLKEAADAYADEHGTTLTAAVADLLDRGLSQVSDERAMADLRASRSRLAEEKAATEAELQTARAQVAALGTFAQQAGRRIGTCPACKQQITGHDLLVTGACRQCGQALSGLIAPARTESAIDQRELMILVGAVGVLLGIAYLASK